PEPPPTWSLSRGGGVGGRFGLHTGKSLPFPSVRGWLRRRPHQAIRTDPLCTLTRELGEVKHGARRRGHREEVRDNRPAISLLGHLAHVRAHGCSVEAAEDRTVDVLRTVPVLEKPLVCQVRRPNHVVPVVRQAAGGRPVAASRIAVAPAALVEVPELLTSARQRRYIRRARRAKA